MRSRLLPLLLLFLLLAAGCASTQQERSILAADRLLAAGEAGEAARLYAAEVAKRPKDAKLAYNHLYALYLAGEYEKTADGADAAFARFPSRLEFLRIKARALSKGGHTAHSEDVWRELFALDPGDHALKARVMEEAYQSGQLTFAEALATELLPVPSYEKRALTLLSAMNAGSWYEAALSYLTNQD